MFKLGLKLYSTNERYYPSARKLYDIGAYDFIELLAVPGSYDSSISMWSEFKIPFVIHAPHGVYGVNLGKESSFDINMKAADETRLFADKLNASSIIYHAGIESDIKETVRQLNFIHDPRVLIENKPYITIDGKYRCNGSSVEDIEYILNATKVGFCLDVAHCCAYACSLGHDFLTDLRRFIGLGPAMFHVSDGDVNSDRDQHAHIGKGNYDWTNILPLLADGSRITIETTKDSDSNLDDFLCDVHAMKSLHTMCVK